VLVLATEYEQRQQELLQANSKRKAKKYIKERKLVVARRHRVGLSSYFCNTVFLTEKSLSSPLIWSGGMTKSLGKREMLREKFAIIVNQREQ